MRNKHAKIIAVQFGTLTPKDFKKGKKGKYTPNTLGMLKIEAMKKQFFQEQAETPKKTILSVNPNM